MYAAIRAKRTAVYTRPNSAKAVEPVTYSLIVEPVYLFFIPQTALLLLGFLAIAVSVAIAVDLPGLIVQALKVELDRDEIKKAE